MRTVLLVCALLLAVASTVASVKTNDVVVLYVATNGSDTHTGLSPAAPLASLAGAGSKIAALRSASPPTCFPDVTVVMAPGVYFSKTQQPQLLQPDVLLARSTCPSKVVFQPAANSSSTKDPPVVISGGAPVAFLPPAKPSPGSLFFETSVVLPRTAFAQAHVWNMWRPRNASPPSNSSSPHDYERVPQCISPVALFTAFEGQDSSPPNTQTLTFTASTFPLLGANASDVVSSVFVRIYHFWTSTYSKIYDYAASTLQIVLAGHLNDCQWSGAASGNRYELVNVAPPVMPAAWQDAVLNAPGAICFTFRAISATIVELRVYSKTTFATDRPFVVPVMATVLNVENAAPGSSLANVSEVRFESLTFAHTDSRIDEDCPTGCSQSGAALQTAMVMTANTQKLHFRQARFVHTGGYALWLHGGTVSTVVERCHFTDMGAGGIRVGVNAGGQSAHEALECHAIAITDCTIHDGGHVEQAGCGVLLQRAYDVQIVHNAIFDLFYTGISTGWTWGYSPTSNRNLNVSFNHIYNIGRATLSDMGCVYNLGISPGTVVGNNVCHDVVSFGYGGWGYYADEGTSDVLYENNIAYRTKGSGFHQHYGLDNVVRNNVLAYPISDELNTPDRSCVLSDPAPHNTSVTVTRNILLIDNINASFITTYALTGLTFSLNTYWSNVTAQLQFPPKGEPTSWAEWRKTDTNAILADPLFTHAGAYDFSDMAADSPAIVKCGFEPISTKHVGPRQQQ